MNETLKRTIASLLFPIILIIFSICYVISSKDLKSEIIRYPYFIIVALSILIVFIIIDEIRKNKKQFKSEDEEDVLEVFKKYDLKKIVLLITSSVIYLILIPVVGYYVITCIYAIFLMLWLGERKIIRTIIISACFIIIQYVIFQVFLYLPIPSGFFV